MSGKMIQRHTRLNIFMHWFNAACWLFLLATGLGLIRNGDLEILGGWWAEAMRTLFGGGERMLIAHMAVGLIWAAGFLIYAIAKARTDTIPFIREIFRFTLPRDLLWLAKKGIQMTMGYRALQKISDFLKRRGVDPEIAAPRIPDQGFYNAGQKLFAIPSVLLGVVIAASGVILFLSKPYLEETALVRWAILVHFVAVGLVFAGLLIHVYMAAIAAGERPAFISMFTGQVPESYARHHHRLWWDEVREEKTD